MQILRRLLILIVFVALVVTGFVYWTAEKEISKRKIQQNKSYKINIMFFDKKDADKAAKEFSAKDITSVYKYPFEDYKKEAGGYIVFQEFPKNDAFKDIKKVIESQGFKVTQEDEDAQNKFKLYVGGVYQNKSDAVRFSQEIYSKTIIKFDTETYYKKIPFKFHSLSITGLEKDQAEKIVENLKKVYGEKFYFKMSNK